MSGHIKYKEKYDHALDRMYDLFKYGREVELDLERKLELARDELKRIKVIAKDKVNYREGGCYYAEIDQICDRGLSDAEPK